MSYTIEGKHIIVLGDTTTHGGKVVAASETHNHMGIPVARLGDMVQCPQCKGTYPITEGASSVFDQGKPIALHGHTVACGATLISKKNTIDTSDAETILLAAATCPTNVQTFLNEQAERIAKLAQELQIDPDYLMALSSYESGWLNPHNSSLNNLFGLTKGGGNNLQFKSLDSCVNYWKKKYGEGIKGAKSMKEFTDSLRKMKYNSVNPKYDENLLKQYNYIVKMKKVCTTSKNA